MATPETLTGADILAAARALAPQIRAAADEIEEGRVGGGDEKKDRRLVESGQHPLDRRDGPEIVGHRHREDHQQRADIDPKARDGAFCRLDDGERQGCSSDPDDRREADAMHDPIRHQFGDRKAAARGPPRLVLALAVSSHEHSTRDRRFLAGRHDKTSVPPTW